jgi:hypothetical protein
VRDGERCHGRYIEQDRGRKPSTRRGYRSTIDVHLLPVFGELPIGSVSANVIERWAPALRDRRGGATRC